ncbi:DNA-binding protein [Actinoplanes sp. NPDC051494]|uniref:DNA-binding protein n=1 Tax=Actinoplanes sp. NPDC051494 TaxID=3363907 RepID=UPI0037B0895F
MPDIFARPDPAAQRVERSFRALTHLSERHAGSPELRQRQTHPTAASPEEVLRLVTGLVGGSIVAAPHEEAVDRSDLVAALTLLPSARADLNAIELDLITASRSRGMTWQDIAFGLGLNTPQAAKQRYERLEARSGEEDGV